jgi:uncharacterized membrane protein YdjX (TVP38/TMEM64 family)
MSTGRALPRVALVLLLVATAGWVVMQWDQINLTTLDAWLGSLGPYAPIGYVILYALGTVSFVPGVVLTLAGGALFGPLWGSVWNLTGATLGATLAFLVARYIAGDWIARKAGGFLKRVIDGADAEGWRFVAFVRLVPLFPFNLDYVFGLTRIPLHHYVIATLVCMAPGVVAHTWLGHAGRGALNGEADAVRYGLLVLGLLATIAVLPRLLRGFRRAPSVNRVERLPPRAVITGRDGFNVIAAGSSTENGANTFAGALKFCHGINTQLASPSGAKNFGSHREPSKPLDRGICRDG